MAAQKMKDYLLSSLSTSAKGVEKGGEIFSSSSHASLYNLTKCCMSLKLPINSGVNIYPSTQEQIMHSNHIHFCEV